MFLDIRRPQGDTSNEAEILRRFVHRFRKDEWPGSRFPPGVLRSAASLSLEQTERSSLHAKCVVVDGRAAFVSSANFTEAAQVRKYRGGRPDPQRSVRWPANGAVRVAAGGGFAATVEPAVLTAKPARTGRTRRCSRRADYLRRVRSQRSTVGTGAAVLVVAWRRTAGRQTERSLADGVAVLPKDQPPEIAEEMEVPLRLSHRLSIPLDEKHALQKKDYNPLIIIFHLVASNRRFAERAESSIR